MNYYCGTSRHHDNTSSRAAHHHRQDYIDHHHPHHFITTTPSTYFCCTSSIASTFFTTKKTIVSSNSNNNNAANLGAKEPTETQARLFLLDYSWSLSGEGFIFQFSSRTLRTYHRQFFFSGVSSTNQKLIDWQWVLTRTGTDWYRLTNCCTSYVVVQLR